MKFRKKLLVVDAINWDGSIEARNKIGEWMGDLFMTHGEYDHPTIRTIHGDLLLNRGEWIIKGEKENDFYPCKPDVFEKTYEKVEEYDVFSDPIFELLNCYEIDGSQINDGKAHIDSGEAETLTKKIRSLLGYV